MKAPAIPLPPASHLQAYRWQPLDALQSFGLSRGQLRKVQRWTDKRARKGAVCRVLVWPGDTWCVLCLWPLYFRQANGDGRLRRSRASQLQDWEGNPGVVVFDLDSVADVYRMTRQADARHLFPIFDLRHESYPAAGQPSPMEIPANE